MVVNPIHSIHSIYSIYSINSIYSIKSIYSIYSIKSISLKYPYSIYKSNSTRRLRLRPEADRLVAIGLLSPKPW